MSADEEKTTKMEEKLKDITDCCICLETYREPRILPCIHTFCLSCLEKIGTKTNRSPGDEMPCPICRKELSIPENGFSGLQKNFFMERLVEIRKMLNPSVDRILCDLCAEDSGSAATYEIPSAEVYCVDCLQKLCQECCRHHRKNKLSKFHKIIALEGHMFMEDCMETVLPTFCDQHNGKPLEMYCSVCQTVMCAMCFIELHKAHDGLPINNIVDDFREQIQKNTENFPKYVAELVERRTIVETGTAAFVQKTEDIEIEINSTREELKQLVDKHSESLLLQLKSLKQGQFKKSEIQKDEIETLIASLESYETYCKQITSMGSASDICGAVSNLNKRAEQLNHMYKATIQTGMQPKDISLRKTAILNYDDENIVGKIKQREVPTRNPQSSSYQLEISKSEETITEYAGSETEVETAQSKKDMSATIKELNEELENERLRAEELEEARNMLSDRIKECESNEQRFSKRVKDLEQQVNLLRCLAYGEEEETKERGNINWDAEATVASYTPMEPVCDPTNVIYRVYGIGILGNELFIAGNDGAVVISDLTTLKFKRRWKMPFGEQLSDIKHCNTNKCLYMLCDYKSTPDITRVDPNGKILSTWSVCSIKGQISVTSESNILLTTSFSNSYELCEYTPDGELIQSIPLSWNSGIELASHAIKLTSEHYLVCHGNSTSPLARVCLVDKTGNVLKYYGEKWNRELLSYPIYMDIDCGGNLFVADHSKQQVLLLNSKLELKRCLIDHATTHPKYDKNTAITRPIKICFDELNGRMFIVENVWTSTSRPTVTGVSLFGSAVPVSVLGNTGNTQCCDAVTVYTIKT